MEVCGIGGYSRTSLHNLDIGKISHSLLTIFCVLNVIELWDVGRSEDDRVQQVFKLHLNT